MMEQETILVRLRRSRRCDVEGCDQQAFWYFIGGVVPGALCLACMRRMSEMNNDNAEVFALVLRQGEDGR